MVTKYFIASPHPSIASRRRHPHDRLHMRRLGEQIERAHRRYAVRGTEPVQITGERRRIAGNVAQPAHRLTREPQGDVPVEPSPRWVYYHGTWLGQRGQHVFRLAGDEPHRARRLALPRAVDRLLVRVHTDHLCAALRQLDRGVADAAVQVPDDGAPNVTQLLDRPAARDRAHLRVDLLERRRGESRGGTGDHACRAVHRLPPADDAVSAGERRAADGELGNPSQRAPHNRSLGGELRLVSDVLQLAAAAMILHVMPTRCRNAGRAGGDDLGELSAGEGLVQLYPLAQPDALARGGAGDEHGAPVREPAHTLPTRRDRRDRHDVAHWADASRRAASSQADCGTAGRSDGDGGGGSAARCSSARSAATTASGRVSAGGGSPTRRRAPARSRYVTSMSPRWNSGSSITRR